MHQKYLSGPRLNRALAINKMAQLMELVAPFAVAVTVIIGANKVWGHSFRVQVGSIWVANLLMLVLVYEGLRRRRQSWSHFGLSLHFQSWRGVVRTVVSSLWVCAFAVGAFMAGAVLMANIVGMPEGADMSRYNYLRGNLWLTILALGSVYFVSSFCEEVIYRGFLITRITELADDSKAATWLAVVTSSFVFGLIHSEWGVAGMVQASLMGLALGVSYLRVRRNLWVTILAHGYMDTLLILQMYAGAG